MSRSALFAKKKTMVKILNHFENGWYLTLVPNRESGDCGFCPQTVSELENCKFLTIPASVPGNFELDLVRAGLAPDPFYAQNPFLFQQYENRHLWYYTLFSAEDTGDKNTFLRFEGIDTVADIYLNGVLLGHTENMLIGHEFCVEGLLKAENELIVHIFPTVIEARKYPTAPENMAQRYNYDSLSIRKCASMFGWDIMPRFVSGGLWKPVSLIRKPAERLEQFYLYTCGIKESPAVARMKAFFEIRTDEDDVRGLRITLDAVCGDSELHYTHPVWHTCGIFRPELPDPKLWWPKNLGEQPLYDVTVKLTRDGRLCDEKHFRIGVRKSELIHTATTDGQGNGEFVFRINGKKVFCLGTNWVPLDAFPSRSGDHLAPALQMLDDLGCNTVRLWGGNIYEDDAFYDFCDEHGIMVWQDFGMGCAIYPQDDRFKRLIYDEAVFVIKRLRHHPSLVLWAGDNEVDISYVSSCFPHDPTTNDLTRKVLPRALREHDTVRPYLPSSPYVSEEAFRTGKPIPEQHLWGARDYFKSDYYSRSTCHFVSEIGYHGCPSPQSLKRFISPAQLYPITDANGTPRGDWLCHAAEMQPTAEGPYAYRIRLMTEQVKLMFGNIPDTLSDFARLSQISQAEADKFFIEHFRIGKWRKTGILWWNLIDGWPQISDAVVDWYGCKKLAYHYIKRSQAPVCLMFDEPKDGRLRLYAVNDLPHDVDLTFTVRNITNGGAPETGSCTVAANTSVCILSLPEIRKYSMFYIEWTTSNDCKGSNHFITASVGIDAGQYERDIQKIGYNTFEGF